MKLLSNVVVIVVLLVTLSVLPATDADAKCEAGDNGPKCSSCAVKGTCAGVAAGGNVINLEPCPSDKSCTIESGLAVCRPTAETDCNCGGETTGCDIYNPQRVNICLPNRRPIQAELCDATQVCADAECVGPEDTVCTGEDNLSFILSSPDCASAALCYDKKVVAVEWCGPGQYFNLESEECEYYSPDPCANCGESMCPILSDCTKYAACANGQLVSEETCASSGTKFDFGQQKCTTLTPLDNPCAAYEDCDFDLIATLTTTTTTTEQEPPVVTRRECTAANVGQKYPHETDCKRYYMCREVARSDYRYVELLCQGETVFDSVNRYCELPSKVAGCP